MRSWIENDRDLVLAIRDAVYPEYRIEPSPLHLATQLDAPSTSPYRYVAFDDVTVETLLFARLIDDLGELQATTAQARVRDDQPEALAFLQHRGFAPVQQMYALELDVGKVDLAWLKPVVESAIAQGIALTTLAQLRDRDEEYLTTLYLLQNAVLPDWPDPDPDVFSPVTIEDLANRLEAEAIRPDAFFIAVNRDQFVG